MVSVAAVAEGALDKEGMGSVRGVCAVDACAGGKENEEADMKREEDESSDVKGEGELSAGRDEMGGVICSSDFCSASTPMTVSTNAAKSMRAAAAR